MRRQKIFLILHNVRSAHNVGSAFRTADATGVAKIYLTGYTPLPVDKFGKHNAKIAKTALGAESFVPWEHRRRLLPLITHLQNDAVHVIALEQDKKSIPYTALHSVPKCALLVGSERGGLSKKNLTRADTIIEIPMRGHKESLNLSVALGIALFEIMKPHT